MSSPKDRANKNLPDNVIRLQFAKKKDKEVIKLCHLSDDLDAVVKHYLLDENVDIKDLVAVFSHRLGSVLNMVQENKELWEVCERVLLRQAQIEAEKEIS
jgi:hypothetical protein